MIVKRVLSSLGFLFLGAIYETGGAIAFELGWIYLAFPYDWLISLMGVCVVAEGFRHLICSSIHGALALAEWKLRKELPISSN
jgi:hypothetical protein